LPILRKEGKKQRTRQGGRKNVHMLVKLCTGISLMLPVYFKKNKIQLETQIAAKKIVV